jgi:hypothetical protein
MNIDELEEALAEVLPFVFKIDTDVNGQVIILTGHSQDEDGDLVELENEDDEEDEEDDDIDPDFEPFADDNDD